jgi:c-di-GMP-binding flagellar brake protein YcgR
MEEKRQYKRIYFSSDEYVTARFTLMGTDGFFHATILNLGEGGLGLLLKKLENTRPSTDDIVVLDQIEKTAGDLNSLVGIKAKVVWVAQLEELQTIGFGCEFVDLLPEVRQNLQKFCTDWEKHRR